MPEVAPASTVMLHRTRRPEVDMRRMVEPWNSMTLKLAPSAVSLPTRFRMMSLGSTPRGSAPSTFTLMVPGTSTFRILPRAHTAAISVAPMPKENAPRAPWLVVWLSVPTTTVPGST